jgi:hypothetical protein
MDHLSENNDTEKIENEKIFLMRMKKMKPIRKQHSIFYEHEKCKKENSIVLEVRKTLLFIKKV